MRVAVMAAGGIGGYYGGLLAKSGHEVTFVARGAHLQAIRQRGLQVRSFDDEFVIHPARVTDDPGSIGPVDLVLFCVKTYDTGEASKAIKSIVRQDTAIVTFQNGVESAEQIRSALGKGRVVPAPTQIETFIAAPGVIMQKSDFRIVTFAESDIKSIPAIESLAGVFQQSHLKVSIVEDVNKAVWLKFLRLAPVAGLATLTREAPYELMQSEQARETISAAMGEIMSVGIAEGVAIDRANLAEALDWAVGLKPGIKPSMQKDIERGNRLEVDALSGAVVRLGKKHEIDTPVNLTISAALKPVDERNRRAMQSRGSSLSDLPPGGRRAQSRRPSRRFAK